MIFHPSARARRLGAGVLALTLALGLSACGGSAPGATTSSSGGSNSGGSGSSSTSTTPTVAVSFADSSGVAIPDGQQPNISGSTPLRAVATLKQGSTPIANQLVTFTAGTAGLVSFDPSTGTVLTDSNGKASIAVTAAGSATGATLITASAAVVGSSTITAGTYTGSAGVQVNGVSVASITVDPTLTLSPATLSAYGTASVTAKVLQNGASYSDGTTVTFTQGCGSGASITSSVISQSDGTATATFTDAGCAVGGDKNVVITATVGSSSATSTLRVRSPSSGSLMFTSVTPSTSSIVIKGNGGLNRQEYATLIFKVVDLAGTPVPNVPVCFNASAYTGALDIDHYYYVDESNNKLPDVQGDASSPCAANDMVRYVKSTGSDGTVKIQVHSGDTPTSVTILARAFYPIGSSTLLSTVSSSLTISTGLPYQHKFDLAIDKANIDGMEYSGETAVVTARVNDWFGNPVPDGTVVNMITSGGAICTSSLGSCTTSNGVCSCNLVTQEERPADGRVVVLAYAKGREAFTDNDHNNKYNSGDGFTTGPNSDDLADAYLDKNKSGAFEAASDIGIPLQGTGNYVTGDGMYTQAGVDIRRSGIVYFSKMSEPILIFVPDGNRLKKDAGGNYYVSLNEVADCSGATIDEVSLTAYLDDGIGNPMAAGTTVNVSDRSSNVSAEVTFGSTVPAVGFRAPSVTVDGLNAPKTSIAVGTDPTLVNTTHTFKIKGVANACTGTGSVTISVKSPKGSAVPARILFRNVNGTLSSSDTRETNRFSIPVRYEAR